MAEKPFKLVDGVKVFLTAAEIAAKQADEDRETEAARATDLKPHQFEWLLARLKMVRKWSALEDQLEELDPALYEIVHMQRFQRVMRLEVTIALVTQLGPHLEAVGIEITADKIREEWANAVNV